VADLPASESSSSASCAVLEGALLVEGGAGHTNLAAGSSISYDSGEPHRFSNTGDTPAVGIWGLCEH
jgi:quercetin dioxygenase-like cupin family protein